jgi:uncharacterized protein
MKKLYLIITLLLYALNTSQAAETPDNKPFAEQKVVLQISDPNPLKQTQVLNVASNLIKHYGPDKVDVEIVAFGPGLRLLFKDNSNKDRISSLDSNGVRFAACKNTIKGMTSKLGHAPELHGNATPVTAGVVRIIDLVNQGYSLVKP